MPTAMARLLARALKIVMTQRSAPDQRGGLINQRARPHWGNVLACVIPPSVTHGRGDMMTNVRLQSVTAAKKRKPISLFKLRENNVGGLEYGPIVVARRAELLSGVPSRVPWGFALIVSSSSRRQLHRGLIVARNQ